ncbi:phosphoenolpyruvate carboxykinase (ATP) [Algoriphagus halophytocola]|uniref:Phosphoenolpyruvate carboxykinase (ATP) n=1 Tax=Algoriphagus halophytocola TaxID=2991499 RepID=A0ABY6MHV9_9BACT|nr:MULTISPECIES: phosphoenolpyruvate carboxykinase (ATP) [unclassified Algoriphagus]UZD23382.1 phosphoenolpyruvate carboxykinase (ATP) [Algoriphagus sp. TR-M5]WBL44677.1 phosphoenolpyruvate carboxykinase (ATP) [Algoriphagus sp. TR-M9]
MQEIALAPQTSDLAFLDSNQSRKVHYNLSPAELIETALARKEGFLTSTGAFMADTGTFTGRSPKDRFIVMDHKTRDSVWWGDINIPFDPEKFEALYAKMKSFLADKELFVRDAFAGADPNHRLNLKIVNTLAWHNLFCHNMFLRPNEDEKAQFNADFTIICAPDFQADPATDGTRSANFAILNLSKRIILIGGTGYAGEMKKGIFSVLNFILPHDKQILSMHCSANVGKDGDAAIFFGLSGTGKTTLSADPNRNLIGDDEHAWTEHGVFNFEGGCYAKVIDLSREKEPEIWDAIRFGAVVENTRFKPNTREVDYSNKSVTENTRTAYPITHIDHAIIPSIAGIPKNIFFLTADAFGVMPPISKLNKNQAMYHFISGYTAKVAGTEMGITEPKLTFSACFGAAFLPLHPSVYAKLLGQKMEQHDTHVWLVNTGWTGGAYGVGQRMKLSHTRAMISAALNGSLAKVAFQKHPVFGFEVPLTCPNVPHNILNPRDTWADPNLYDQKAVELGKAFEQNFEKFKDLTAEEILRGAPFHSSGNEEI